MSSDTVSGDTVQASERTLAIVEALGDGEKRTLTELAADLDLPRSTLHGYLSSMVNAEYLVKEDGAYRLGLRFLDHGIAVQRANLLYEAAGPILEQVADETRESVWLVVEEYGQAVCLRKAKGDLAIQPYKTLGGRLHLHSIAAGKAILAHLPESRVHEIIDHHGLPAFTDATITDRDRLFDGLERIAETGVAFNDGESLERFRAVASPVCLDGEVLGSLVVSGPKNRLRGDRFTEEIPDTVTGAANALELEVKC
ncbi:IclR family transcriptional regulator [Halorubrum sp. DTA46]|uniref:IclR family transcriptional regulator n=1 Tax=Halorubrum sp. DTA46 TaxID=3402162 RepID=UPI003AB02C1D